MTTEETQRLQIEQLKKDLAYEGMRYSCALIALSNTCKEFGVSDMRDRLRKVRNEEGVNMENQLRQILDEKGSFYGNPIPTPVQEEDDGTPV